MHLLNRVQEKKCWECLLDNPGHVASKVELFLILLFYVAMRYVFELRTA